MNILVSESLRDLAASWPTYSSTARQSNWPADRPDAPCVRCGKCDEVIYETELGVAGHLLQSHGYRMDGRQWTDSNKEIH